MNCIIGVAKTKALISFVVTAPLFSHMQNVCFLMTRLNYVLTFYLKFVCTVYMYISCVNLTCRFILFHVHKCVKSFYKYICHVNGECLMKVLYVEFICSENNS